jgi:hypothetical protein
MRQRARWTRKTLSLRVLLALTGAVIVLSFSATPVSAAPDDEGPGLVDGIQAGVGIAVPGVNLLDPIIDRAQKEADDLVGDRDQVKDNDQYTCTQAPDGSWQGDCDSDIAKQCNGEKEVDEKFTDTWVGLAPAVVGCGAIVALDWTIQALGLSLDNTEVHLTTNEGRNQGQWFQTQYRLVRTVAIWTIPPIFFIALVHAVFSGRYDRLLQAGLVYLPISLLGSVVAIVFVQQLLYITDDITKVFQDSIQGDAQLFMVAIARGFGPEGFVVTGDGTAAWFMSLLLAFGILLAAAVVYIILSLREASIYIAALFFPIIFAMLIWPPLHKWFKKLVEFIIGMIISKIIMVAAISLMVASMASITGFDSVAAQGLGLDGQSTADQDDDQGFIVWISQCITLIFTFFVVCFAPNIPSKLFANVGFEDTRGAQTALMNRPDMKRKIDWGNRMVGIGTQLAGFAQSLTQWGPTRNAGREMNSYDRALQGMGIRKQGYSDREVKAAGFGVNPPPPGGTPPAWGTKQYFNEFAARVVKKWGNSRQFNEKYFAAVLMSIGGEALETFEVNQGHGPGSTPGDPQASPYGYQVAIWQRPDKNGNMVRCAEIVMNTFDRNNQPIDVLPQSVVAAIQETLAAVEASGAGPLKEIKVHAPTPGITTSGTPLDGNTQAAFGPSDARRRGQIQAQILDRAVKAMPPPANGTVVTMVKDAYATNLRTWGESLRGNDPAPVGAP